jgi:hypothetical protein
VVFKIFIFKRLYLVVGVFGEWYIDLRYAGFWVLCVRGVGCTATCNDVDGQCLLYIHA